MYESVQGQWWKGSSDECGDDDDVILRIVLHPWVSHGDLGGHTPRMPMHLILFCK